jgi:hypothetical protein
MKLTRLLVACAVALSLLSAPVYAYCWDDIVTLFEPDSGASLADATGALYTYDPDIFWAIHAGAAQWYSDQCEMGSCPDDSAQKTYWLFEILAVNPGGGNCAGDPSDLCSAWAGGPYAVQSWLDSNPAEANALYWTYFAETGGQIDPMDWLMYWYLPSVCNW